MKREDADAVLGDRRQGLITLEAACIFPVIFIVIYFFLYFFQVISLQESLHAYATKTARMISSYGMVVNELMSDSPDTASDGSTLKDMLGMDSDDPLSEMFEEIDFSTICKKAIDNLVVQGVFYETYHDNALIKHCISGGFDGISFLGSYLLDDEGYVTVRLSYDLNIPVVSVIVPRLPVIIQVRIKSFQGHAVPSKLDTEDETNEKDEIVYVTEHGSVYHTNVNCSHLRISVQSIAYAKVGQARNKSGAKYYPCEVCLRTMAKHPEIVYITQYGTSYHLNSDCSCIKREVKAVSKDEVAGMCECKRCQAYRKQEE